MHDFFIWLKVCCIPPNVGGSEKSRLWVGIGGSEKNRLWCVANGMSDKHRYSKSSKWPPPARIHASFYVTFGSLLSQIRTVVCLSSVCLSSVTLMHPTQGVEPFGNISSPLCTLAILWPSCKILRKSSQRNSSVGSVKRKRGIKIQRFWTHRRLYLINGTR